MMCNPDIDPARTRKWRVGAGSRTGGAGSVAGAGAGTGSGPGPGLEAGVGLYWCRNRPGSGASDL